MHVGHHSSSRTDPCQPLPCTRAEIKEIHREFGEKGKNELCKHTRYSWVVFQEIQSPLEAAGAAPVGCQIL